MGKTGKSRCNALKQDPQPAQNGAYVVDDSPFTLAELDYVLSRSKPNKSPGFDGVPSELFKWLDQTNRQLVLAAANKMSSSWGSNVML